MSEEKIIEKPKTKIKACSGVCSSYDDDCKDIKDPRHCWVGNKTLGMADGICPMIHSEN